VTSLSAARTTFGVWSTAREICSFVTNIVTMPTLREHEQVPDEMLTTQTMSYIWSSDSMRGGGGDAL
jgi:hypothetical protein